KPHRVALTLAELCTVTVCYQGCADGMHRCAFCLADELRATREVAPLVATSGLQHAVVVAVELKKVEALQHLVTELGVANAVTRIEPRTHGILLQHGSHAEMLTDVA